MANAAAKLFICQGGGGVGLHVDNHRLLVLEFLAAEAAQLPPLAARRAAAVQIKGLRIWELQSACVAKIRNFCAMHSFLVFLQVCPPEELLRTFRTFVTLPALVKNNVILQVWFL